jgi:hypothetical protein
MASSYEKLKKEKILRPVDTFMVKILPWGKDLSSGPPVRPMATWVPPPIIRYNLTRFYKGVAPAWGKVYVYKEGRYYVR